MKPFLRPLNRKLTRRKFLRAALIGGALGGSGTLLLREFLTNRKAFVFTGKIADYHSNPADLIRRGLQELGIGTEQVSGKRILLKPNLVEPHSGAGHINTHPLVVQAAAEVFLRLGAAEILVAEGAGHQRDTRLVLEESGLDSVLRENHLPFVDLNQERSEKIPNQGHFTALPSFFLPTLLRQVDWIVSMPKLKTHHWAGVTLSMKNLFGVMPGIHYGWPKNVLHQHGISQSILDINATLKPHFAIVDGIVGMEGDGPIMGTPKFAGVMVMGKNLTAVDATCSRIMGIDPGKIDYLAAAADWLGPIDDSNILQAGELPVNVRTDFQLVDAIPAHRGIRLMES